jgi:hypothetical protein
MCAFEVDIKMKFIYFKRIGYLGCCNRTNNIPEWIIIDNQTEVT